MSNPMKYIRALEAAGFERNQAEAQVQVVLDAIEGDLVTKSDFAVFKEHIDRKFAEVDYRFREMSSEMSGIRNEMNGKFDQQELRIVVKLGIIMVSTVSIAVAIMTWLIKVQ